MNIPTALPAHGERWWLRHAVAGAENEQAKRSRRHLPATLQRLAIALTLKILRRARAVTARGYTVDLEFEVSVVKAKAVAQVTVIRQRVLGGAQSIDLTAKVYEKLFRKSR